jgi:diaminopimelate epimerase
VDDIFPASMMGFGPNTPFVSFQNKSGIEKSASKLRRDMGRFANMNIAFTKMSGSGNDFVIIDNRSGIMAEARKREFVRKVCAPKTSVGADGVIFVENSDAADYRWDFYNADGSSAEMCGNGGRCVARYAYERNIAPRRHSFETLAGIISAEVNGRIVKVRLTVPRDLRQNQDVKLEGGICKVDSLDTGVPHAVLFSNDVDSEDVQRIGRSVRYHELFAPRGTNVNFVEVKDRHSLKIRTYERGVEGETLACGTGVVAASILSALKNKVEPPVSAQTRGGELLTVHFALPANGIFGDVFLEGLTRTAFEGTLIELD